MQPSHQPIPPTAELIRRLKPPRRTRSLERVENALFVGLACVYATLCALAIAKVFGFELPLEVRPYVVVALLGLILLFPTLFVLVLLIQGVQAIRGGFAARAEDLDLAIAHEAHALLELRGCCADALELRADRVALESTLLNRRIAAMASVVTLGSLMISLQKVGGEAALWATTTTLQLWVYAGSVGALIGALLLLRYTGWLDRVANHLRTAAKQSRTDDAKRKERAEGRRKHWVASRV